MISIRVYRADLDRLCVKACFSVLEDAEKRRAGDITNRYARHEFVKTRALLRLLLSKHTGRPARCLQVRDRSKRQAGLAGISRCTFQRLA